MKAIAKREPTRKSLKKQNRLQLLETWSSETERLCGDVLSYLPPRHLRRKMSTSHSSGLSAVIKGAAGYIAEIRGRTPLHRDTIDILLLVEELAMQLPTSYLSQENAHVLNRPLGGASNLFKDSKLERFRNGPKALAKWMPKKGGENRHLSENKKPLHAKRLSMSVTPKSTTGNNGSAMATSVPLTSNESQSKDGSDSQPKNDIGSTSRRIEKANQMVRPSISVAEVTALETRPLLPVIDSTMNGAAATPSQRSAHMIQTPEAERSSNPANAQTLTRPEPTVTPASLPKSAPRVFQARVDKDLLQEEVNNTKFLEDFLQTLGVDNLQVRQVKTRVLNHGDSLENAVRAVCPGALIKRAKRG
jgi:hypothetical protein